MSIGSGFFRGTTKLILSAIPSSPVSLIIGGATEPSNVHAKRFTENGHFMGLSTPQMSGTLSVQPKPL
jgi:hypothetical protein